MARTPKYVIITPARNEDAYIEKTIEAVTAQTILPEKWVIVSDGSTDRTDDIVKRYEKNYDFIQLLRIESDCPRNFASKVYAIRAGIERLDGFEYNFLGILDADVSFEPSYYERVLTKFRENPKLGIAGGILSEPHAGEWTQQLTSTSWSVSGPIQMFRRQCYEDIGGYITLQKGGVDAVAEVMARMHKWEVRSFPDIKVLHHRPTGSSYGNILYNRFHIGIKEYSYGNHLLFEMAKCFWRVREKPYVFGSVFRLSGYFWAFLRRDLREVPADVVGFMRHEQMQRLIKIFNKN